ncbi:MAG: tetratricopeptide repeat protein, partial [Saprospiraceae bacterium]|nr:tetratricopeptide repeat protein [Saprospiraceae bacterium]
HYMYPTLQSYIHAYRGMGQEPVYDPEKGTESIQHFRKALAIQPELPQVWIEMAFTFGLNLHEYDSAVYYANKAIAAVPNWTHAYTTMALICLTKSDTAEAKTWLDRAFRFDSTSSLILSALGDWYRGQGQIELAKQYLEKSIDKGSTAVCDILWLSILLFNEGHVEDAERMAKKAIKLFPASVTAYNTLAGIYINSRQFEKSEHTWIQLIEEDSTRSLPYIHLGHLYQITGQYLKSIKNYEKAVSLDGNNPGIYLGLAHLYALFEDWESMLTDYRKVSLLEPRYKYLLAWADLYNNNFDEARQILQQFPPDLSNDGAVLLTHASYRILIRDYKEAEAVLLKGIALGDRRKSRLMTLLGHVYLATGRKVEGEKVIKDACSVSELRNDPSQKVYFYQTQGGLFRSAGRYDEAIALFKPMLEVDANDPEIHMELARSYSCKGDQQTALFHLEEALENGYQEVDQLVYNTSFKNIRETKAWKALLKEYFPEHFKN